MKLMYISVEIKAITYLPFFLYRIEITIRMIMTLTTMFIRVTSITYTSNSSTVQTWRDVD